MGCVVEPRSIVHGPTVFLVATDRNRARDVVRVPKLECKLLLRDFALVVKVLQEERTGAFITRRKANYAIVFVIICWIDEAIIDEELEVVSLILVMARECCNIGTNGSRARANAVLDVLGLPR